MHILIVIVSDIHGNLPALESVLEDINKYNVTKIISLGDVSGYYPFINEVIGLLKLYDAVNIVGNHDRYIIDNTECPRSDSANVCLKYQKEIITNSNKEWLKQSINKYEFDNITMVHGGWRDPVDEYMYQVTDEYFHNLNYKYFFCGHTHVQICITLGGGKVFVNPGSVGQPRDGNKKAAYCIFDENSHFVELKRVNYNIDCAAKEMKRLGFDEKLYSNLYMGTRIDGRIDKIQY